MYLDIEKPDDTPQSLLTSRLLLHDIACRPLLDIDFQRQESARYIRFTQQITTGAFSGDNNRWRKLIAKNQIVCNFC